MNDNDGGNASIKEAESLERQDRNTEALFKYQLALESLMKSLKGMSGELEKAKLRDKINAYMSHAEQLKKKIKRQQQEGSFHEKIIITQDSIGHSYEALFGRFLDEGVTNVTVYDPYIRSDYQCHNFVMFCELVAVKCKNVKTIKLFTVSPLEGGDHHLSSLVDDLRCNDIELILDYSKETLHDREIILSTGWVIKIGRGLDYFQRNPRKFHLGLHDADLRKCKETVVDIFHSKNVYTICSNR